MRRQELVPEFGDRGLAGVGIMLQRAVDRVRQQPVGQRPERVQADSEVAVSPRGTLGAM